MLLLAAILAVSGISIAAAAAATRLGWPRGRIVVGVLVGVLLGPSVLGRVAPSPWEHVFVGAVPERTALDNLDREHRAWSLAASHAGLSVAEQAPHDEAYSSARAPLEAARSEATAVHRGPWMVLILLLAFATALMAPATARQAPGVRRAKLAVGVWAATVPALGFLLFVGAVPAPEALLMAAALAIGPGRSTGARGATLAAFGLALVVAVDLPLAWFVVAITIPGLLGVRPSAHLRRRLRKTCEVILLPSLAAMTVIQVDVLAEATLLEILVVTILAGDGRWLGAAIGLALQGTARIERVVADTIGFVDDAMIPQLSVIAVLSALQLISPSWVTSLLAATIVIELTSPLRRRIAAWLRRAPSELPS